MADIKRTALFGRLDPLAYKAMESATVLCKMRGNPYVELVHWLQQVLQLPDSDFHRIIKYGGLDPSRLAADLTAAARRHRHLRFFASSRASRRARLALRLPAL